MYSSLVSEGYKNSKRTPCGMTNLIIKIHLDKNIMETPKKTHILPARKRPGTSVLDSYRKRTRIIVLVLLLHS